MKKALVALGVLALAALVRPAPAAADFSLSIGLPGFGLHVHDPAPPPVYYGPPVYYPRPYYAPRVAYHHYHSGHHKYCGKHGRGHYKHRRHSRY
jgi:hypothetical protein